jgi:Cys-tRNA(Pro)/Cys-tRNA(Cys) deacylase
MKEQKTIVEKFLEKNKIKFNSYSYPSDKAYDGLSVANFIKKDSKKVFKTLVCTGSNNNCVFVIPVDKELDLKLAAKASDQKRVEMLKQKDLLPVTGYVHGGCSPIGMKKMFPTYIDASCRDFDTIIFSAGRIGRQVEMSVEDLQKLTKAEIATVTKEKVKNAHIN